MKTQKKKIMYSYPGREEIEAAQLACCGRHCNACEAPAEYAWRKRDVDMALLLEKAIRNELTEAERSAVELYWFDGKSKTEIANKRGVTPAAVKITIDRAEEKLKKVLGYAVCYQQNTMNESVIPIAVGRAMAVAAARKLNGVSVGERISLLRQSQNLPHDVLGTATGINSSRIKKIENGAEPDNSELVLLSEFFGVTTDYILKGEKG